MTWRDIWRTWKSFNKTDINISLMFRCNNKLSTNNTLNCFAFTCKCCMNTFWNSSFKYTRKGTPQLKIEWTNVNRGFTSPENPPRTCFPPISITICLVEAILWRTERSLKVVIIGYGMYSLLEVQKTRNFSGFDMGFIGFVTVGNWTQKSEVESDQNGRLGHRTSIIITVTFDLFIDFYRRSISRLYHVFRYLQGIR